MRGIHEDSERGPEATPTKKRTRRDDLSDDGDTPEKQTKYPEFGANVKVERTRRCDLSDCKDTPEKQTKYPEFGANVKVDVCGAKVKV